MNIGQYLFYLLSCHTHLVILSNHVTMAPDYVDRGMSEITCEVLVDLGGDRSGIVIIMVWYTIMV